MKHTGHIITLLLITAMLLPVHTSAQTEASIVYSGQVSADASSSSVAQSSKPQAEASDHMREYEVFFRFDKTDIDLEYLDNKANLATLRHYLGISHRVDSITIYSYASPEGRQKHNQWLSQERAKSTKKFLLAHSPDSSILNAEMIRICPLSENWPGLLREVEKRYFRRDRERVLRILNNKNISDDTRKWRLGRLDGGYTWSFLRRIYMPELRVSTWICVYGDIAMPFVLNEVPSSLIPSPGKSMVISDAHLAEETQEDTTAQHAVADSALTSGKKSQKAQKWVQEPLDPSQRTILALKTNLLLDAVTALNYSIEVPVNEHFSLQYFQTTPWWKSQKNNFCLQFLSFGGEARWWFLPRTRAASATLKQRDALVGHFLGAYGWGGNGDLQLGRNVCQQFDFWSAGLTYGYAMPVSKNLNMEFTLSVGYANINYQHYIPTDDFSLLVRDPENAGKLHFIGPTKAEISLVIPIRAQTNKKGGTR